MVLPDLSHPEQLAWLLLLPVLYWLSLPPRPRKRVTTAHMPQWQAAVRRLGRRPVKFRKLRFWLLVLGLLAIVGAMAGPSIGAVEGPRRLVVLIDTSASLAAGTGDDTAFAQLKTELSQGLASVPEGIEVRFAICGEGIRVVRGEGSVLLAALPDQPASAGQSDWEGLAAALTDEETAVWTLTDGMGESPLPSVGALSVVGLSGANMGLTACRIDDRWPLPDLTLALEAQRFGPGPESLTVKIAGGVETADAPVITLDRASGDHAMGTLDIKLRRSTGGWLTLSIEDAAGILSADNQVRLWIPPAPAPDIAVLTEAEAGPAIRWAAEALAAESGGRVVESGAEQAGFLLVEGGHLEELPKRAISFGTSFGKRPASSADLVEDPQVLDWDREDGMTAGLDLSELEIRRALRVSVLPPGKVLIRSESGPLLVVVEGEESSSVHFAFRLSDSNLPLLPALPQLLRRAYARSYGAAAQPRFDSENLLSAAESDLRRAASPSSRRSLPAFGRDGNSLVVPLLLLALFALVARVYT